MNKEEAINVLNDYDINFERNTPEEVAEAHEMAIKALEQQSSENYVTDLNGRSAEEIAEAFNMAIKNIKTIPSEDEKVIRIKKGTLKARTGRYVIYDVEWLKEHYSTTEAKIYGQPSEDCISRKAVLSIIKSICFSEEYVQFRADYGINGQRDAAIIYIKALPSVTPQPKEEPQPKTGHWVLSGGYWRCSECKEKALLKLDKATGGYREYEPVRSKYCPECGAKMQEEKK